MLGTAMRGGFLLRLGNRPVHPLATYSTFSEVEQSMLGEHRPVLQGGDGSDRVTTDGAVGIVLIAYVLDGVPKDDCL
jgi:hypothetical protein